MIGIAKTIFDVAKGILGLQGELAKARRDRRERLATYFSELAALVEAVSASLRIDQYPYGSCAQLHELATRMKTTVKGIVSEAEAQEFQDKLLQVWQIEQLYGELRSASPAQAQRELNRLDEAAGSFRAVAAHLRVV